MNDKVGDGTTTSENELIGSKFLSVKCKYPQKRGNKSFTTDEYLVKNFYINLMRK